MLVCMLYANCIDSIKYTGRIGVKKLERGDEIVSETGENTKLIMQPDGNLVLYNDGNPLWATGTNGAWYASFQSDGNLCVYESFFSSKTKWCSKSNGHHQSQLVVENACVFIMNGDGKRVWNTGTKGCRWPKVPCIRGENNMPVGCAERILPCDQIDKEYENADIASKNRINANDNTRCYKTKSNQKLQNTVDDKEGKGNTYIIKFDDKDGNCYGIKMYGGECWSKHPVTGSNYDCMGRCGAGCGSWTCSNWGRDCLKHDVCGWFLSSKGASFDKNCKDEFWQAYNDWYVCMLCIILVPL